MSIATALGIPESAAVQPMEAVLSFLSSKRLLLLIDNFEQVLGAAPVLGELLSGAPLVKLLVTSRASLRVSGEQEFPVAPLSTPSEADITPDAAEASPAISLFVDRARAARPDFVMDRSNAAAIAEISRRLDGLPLAIELAAARVKLLSPTAMLSRLDHRLNLLTGGARDLPQRQQTLRDAIDWSYELLDEPERRLFRRLSVFADGITLEAAEYVGAGPDDPEEMPPDILDLVASLLDKSLIRQEEGELEGRFGMLHTIREFGLEKLDASPYDSDARGRHAEYFLNFAESTAPLLTGRQQLESLRDFALEHDNIRTALDWYSDSNDTQQLVRLALATWWFWYLRGHLVEGRRWLKLAYERLGKESRSISAARIALGYGALAVLQADFALAETILDHGRAIALEHGDTYLAARILAVRGQAAGSYGDQREAVAMLEEAERDQRQLGDQWGLALTLMFHSMRSWALRERDKAEALALESTRIFQELGDGWGAALSPAVLARIAMEEGRYDDARAHLNRALRRWTETGDRWALGHVLNGQGDIARLERNYAEAEARYNESLEIFRGFGNKNGMASALHNLGYSRLYQGDPGKADELFRESLGLFKVLDDKHGVLECIMGLAVVAAHSADGARAACLFGAAEGGMDRLGMTREGSNERDYQEGVTRVKSLLAPEALEAEWQRGRGLTYEQAVQSALRH
jgi:predicted ATPase